MAKWAGQIGFMTTKSIQPGVHAESIETRYYFGDVMRDTSAWKQISSQMNPDLAVNNRISIVSDPYANHHYSEIRWVSWNGHKWKVTGVEVQYPRLILSISGLYIEEESLEEDDYG